MVVVVIMEIKVNPDSELTFIADCIGVDSIIIVCELITAKAVLQIYFNDFCDQVNELTVSSQFAND